MAQRVTVTRVRRDRFRAVGPAGEQAHDLVRFLLADAHAAVG